MNYHYRQATIDDIAELQELAVRSWSQFENQLSPENWQTMLTGLSKEQTYLDLLHKSTGFVCTTSDDKIVGMAFLVPSGNPTDIYDAAWSYIRFVTVDPSFEGKGIGRKLTSLCLELAGANGEKVVALHTSELMAAARHIYESLGFSILKEIDRRFGKRYWLYKLDLTTR